MRKILIVLALLAGNVAFAANENDDDNYVLDAKEDTMNVVTIKNIVKAQQDVVRRQTETKHLFEVWKRKTFFNIAFNPKASLTPVKMTTTIQDEDEKTKKPKLSKEDKTEIPVTNPENASQYVNEGKAVRYTNDWGFAVQNGRSFRLHKNPIAKMLTINLDYTWIDLSATHYSRVSNEKEGKNKGKTVVDTESMFSMPTDIIEEYGVTRVDSTKFNYTPFNATKMDVTFGMSLGPSITIAPFVYTKVKSLHHLKINAFYHLGYCASLLFIDAHKDFGQNGLFTTIDFATGFYTAWGMSFNWKAIGFGFEKRLCGFGKKIDKPYTSWDSDDYSKNEYQFKNETTRIYLQFRF